MKIFIDPGHGGQDTGAVGRSGKAESEITFQTALRLSEILRKRGFETLLSRGEGETLSLMERANKANQAEADYFISIHCNSSLGSANHGCEMFASPGCLESERLAQQIYQAVLQRTAFAPRGVKLENFAVLRMSNMPAVLIETAFLTNQEDEEMLLRPDFPQTMARAIAEGICTFTGIPAETPTALSAAEDCAAFGSLEAYMPRPESWRDPDARPTNSMVLTLLYNILQGGMKHEGNSQ